ncbi:FAD-dependent oxidoreductase [Pseudanabaena sp. FACHB-2040]|uniref:FAD-dependent oxidoreductase n=1 Tax=Pseudanabaena sp. FACHB-2040 TaxID=2692859 RepID=UPI001683902F|nr:FAD-dependent oxidoreductase [Pseudanabaena sp. FACHB-2040]
MVWDVVVVGAGMAGLLCARRLEQAGYQVRVLEKSRGLGGRMATRRVNDQPIDHGCRFITPTTPLIDQLVQQLELQGLVRPWQPASYKVTPDGQLAVAAPKEWWVAPQGMTAIPKHLAENLGIDRQTRVLGLEAATDSWQISLDEGSAAASEPLTAQAVVLAVPAPQALEILQTVKTQLDPAVWQGLEAVTFEASITVFAGYSSLPETRLAAGSEGWMVYGNPDTPFTWVGLDSGKRDCASVPTVVIQSCDRFAQPYLSAPDLTEAGRHLLEQTAQILEKTLGPSLRQPDWIQVHRWRYATTKSPFPKQSLVTAKPLPLVCCGDWCGGFDVNTAAASGWTAAEEIHNLLSEDSAQFSLQTSLV